MAVVRIIAAPPGEAPEEVRRAWIGLVVPVDVQQGKSLGSHFGVGVLTGPSGFWRRIWAVVTGRAVRWQGFALDAAVCVELLSTHAPLAAAWWRDNTPHLLKPGRKLLFPTDVCEWIADE